MQFLLHLERLGGNGLLPQNYQQELSSFIYKILRRAKSDYKHYFYSDDSGFENKQIKPFALSSLNFDKFVLHPEMDRLQHSGDQAKLDVRFVADREAEGSVRDLFLNQKIKLGDFVSQVEYHITGIETVPPIYFQDEMHFRSLSPIFVSTDKQDGGADYLSPYHEKYSAVFKTNLLKKFLSFYPEMAGLVELEKYCPEIRFELTSFPKKQIINLNSQSQKPIKANGYQFDFKLKASPILQELGYYGGFGSNYTMGFGCVGVVGD